MAIRSIARRGTVVGYANPSSAPIYVASGTNVPYIIPAGSGTTELPLLLGPSTSGVRLAAGTGTLVTGTLIVATGLSTVLGFVANLVQTGATSSGAAEAESISVVSITTGAVSVVGRYHSATAAISLQSASGTAQFYWLALGT